RGGGGEAGGPGGESGECGGEAGGRGGEAGGCGGEAGMTAPAPPSGVQSDVPLARLSTIRTGGPAQYFARAGSEAQLAELLAWARHAGVQVSVIGSGSNLLVADEGVAGLVLKLDRELARIEREGVRLRCGGGARLPAISAHAARAGLSGIE